MSSIAKDINNSEKKEEEHELMDEKKIAKERGLGSLEKISNTDIIKLIIGFSIFVLVFSIVIPYYLFKYKQYEFLNAYMPNVDMIATAISWRGGPNLFTDNDNIWLYLYNPDNTTFAGWLSEVLINYLALLGLTFIVAFNSYKYNSWVKGWSMAIVMCFLTYLVPGFIILKVQSIVSQYMGINVYYLEEDNVHYLISSVIGLIVAALIILLESFILKNYSYIFENIINYFRNYHSKMHK